MKHVQSIPKTVWLLERPDDDDVQITDDGCYSDYAVTDDSVLLKAEIDLKSDQNEDAIRGELQTVFEKRYPGIGLCDFEFVKQERNVITTPIVRENHTIICSLSALNRWCRTPLSDLKAATRGCQWG